RKLRASTAERSRAPAAPAIPRRVPKNSGLERGVHLPDAVPLRQAARQRKQQKRCRLALREERPEGSGVPARPNANLSSISKRPNLKRRSRCSRAERMHHRVKCESCPPASDLRV